MNTLDPIAWSILLTLVGCAILTMEVFIPSGGILGVISAAAFIGAILIAFQRSPAAGISFVATTVVAVPLVLVLAFKYWPKTPMGRAFLGDLPTAEDVLTDDPRRALLGRVGTARSKMLPSGAVEIEGQMIDAMTQGQAIEPGQNVVVIEVRGNRVIVRPAKENERPGRAVDARDVLSRPIEELGIESLEDPLA